MKLSFSPSQPSVYPNGCPDGVFFPKSPAELLSEKMINPVPYIIGVNNCEFGWAIPKVSDSWCCYLDTILLTGPILTKLILSTMQLLMNFPDFNDGLDKDVAYQLLKNTLLFAFKVRNHFQDHPVVLLHCSGSAFVLPEGYASEANFAL